VKWAVATTALAAFAFAVTFSAFFGAALRVAPRTPFTVGGLNGAVGGLAGFVGVAVAVVGGVAGVVVVAAVVVVVAGVAGVVVVVGVVVAGVVVVVGLVVVVGVVVVVVVQFDGRVAFARPGAPGFVPSPQFANSCTLTWTLLLDPAENVPENENPFPELNWPCPTCVQVVPLLVELKTRTSLSVRLALEGPAHAVAVYDALPLQPSETVISELCAEASGTNNTASTTVKRPTSASRRRAPSDRRKPCRDIDP